MFTGGTVLRIRFRPWGLWSLGKKVLAGVLVLAVIVFGAAVLARVQREATFTAVAAGIAVGALFVTAYSAYSAAVRVKKKDTLEAWNKWSDDHREARRRLTRELGEGEITEEQARILADDTPKPPAVKPSRRYRNQAASTQSVPQLKNRRGEAMPDEVVRRLQNDVDDVLNGLERLAVGVELGIFDEAVLRLLGGTIIARTYERFEPYIDAVRESSSTKKRQSRAWSELSVLYHMIEEPRRIASWRSNRKSIDNARLKALRRQ